MKTLVAGLFLASTLAAGTAAAQQAPFNDAGVTMGHWHLASKDVQANKKIFVGMGGTPVTVGAAESRFGSPASSSIWAWGLRRAPAARRARW